MQLVADRVGARIQALPVGADEPRAAVERLLHQIVPLDQERRAEAEVWLAFSARALVDPDLRALHDGVHQALHGLCRQMVEALVATGQAAPGTEIELEADRLHALVDGLTLHALLQPERTPPARVVAVVAHHLDGLRDGAAALS
jgi:hypothetical protein